MLYEHYNFNNLEEVRSGETLTLSWRPNGAEAWNHRAVSREIMRYNSLAPGKMVQ